MRKASAVCLGVALLAVAMLPLLGCKDKHSLTLIPERVLQVTTTSLPDAVEGAPYSCTVTATGGKPTNYQWSASGLPNGLNIDLSTGEISGTPSSGASNNSPYTITVTVTDGFQTATVNLSLTVYAPLQITTTSLPEGYEGQTGYSAQLTATGGKSGATLTWSLVAGSLPAGLAFDTSGLISGDIAAGTAGIYGLVVGVTDGVQTVQANLSLRVWAQLRITTASLPEAQEGVAYGPVQLEATGGTGNYTWGASGLPGGLSIDQATGEISGTPDAGTSANSPYAVTITVQDDAAPVQTANATLTLVVNPAVAPIADFEATPTSGTAPLSVNFTDKSTSTITQWEWDFDNDGATDSTEQNPQWTYTSVGWHTVKLTVTGPGGSDSCVKEKFILVANDVYYVDGVGGNDTNGGTGWNDAWETIGHALSQAGDYDLVLVADATYSETGLNFNGKKICLKGVDHNTAGARPVIDCQQAGRAFYFGSGETEDSVIDNFTIRDGKKDGASYPDNAGGAIFCENSSSPSITNCTFNSNGADWGGAIFCYSSSPSITNCTFSGNSADDGGGAIVCDSSSPSISGCTFSGNSAWDGGAIFCGDSSSSITDCTFNSNKSTLGWGGAIFCDSSSPSISGCTFSGNGAGNGGAIACPSSSLTVTNCTFSSNSAGNNGGAIFCHSSSLTVTNCTFSGNSAGNNGGAIYCRNSSSPTLNNCILWGNSATSGGNEIYINDSGSSCTLNYCCVDNAGYGGVTGNIHDSNNCIHSDPKFACAEVGVLRLKHDSPCIDAGDSSLVPAGVTTDIMGCQRIVGSAVDMGAYEVQGIIYVDDVGGDDANDGLSWTTAKKTIGAGIAAAGDGWFVFVADGTYTGTGNKALRFAGKKVYLLGVDHNNPGQRPVMDCERSGRAFIFESGETQNCIIENFTIQSGRASDGGAIYCYYNSSPTVTNCTFSGNSAVDYGGAIYCRDSSSPTLTDCTFSGNSAGWFGGAIHCENFSNPSITDCTFSNNSAVWFGGALYCGSGSPTLTNCTFSGNSAVWGGAISCSDSSPTITNCTFSGNSASVDGGAIYCLLCPGLTLNNCILWGNSANSSGNEIYIEDTGSSCTLNYCCVDNTGYGGKTGNIMENNCVHADPLFVDPDGPDNQVGTLDDDLRLQDTSPCIDAGDNGLVPSGVDKDLDGNPRIVDGGSGSATVDMGAYEYQP